MVCCVQYNARFTIHQSQVYAIVVVTAVVCCVQYKPRFNQSGLVSAIELVTQWFVVYSRKHDSLKLHLLNCYRASNTVVCCVQYKSQIHWIRPLCRAIEHVTP